MSTKRAQGGKDSAIAVVEQWRAGASDDEYPPARQWESRMEEPAENEDDLLPPASVVLTKGALDVVACPADGTQEIPTVPVDTVEAPVAPVPMPEVVDSTGEDLDYYDKFVGPQQLDLPAPDEETVVSGLPAPKFAVTNLADHPDFSLRALRSNPHMVQIEEDLDALGDLEEEGAYTQRPARKRAPSTRNIVPTRSVPQSDSSLAQFYHLVGQQVQSPEEYSTAKMVGVTLFGVLCPGILLLVMRRFMFALTVLAPFVTAIALAMFTDLSFFPVAVGIIWSISASGYLTAKSWRQMIRTESHT